MSISTLDKLCVHTFTTKPWSIDECIENYARAGVKGITMWRETYAGHDLAKVKQHMYDAGLAPVSVARGGFFCHTDSAARAEAIAENKRAIDECAALDMPVLVLVCGAHFDLNVQENIQQIISGIGELADYAAERNVKLAVEPLHPVYAPTRSAINSMKCANDVCDAINHKFVGVAVDVYHLWWDHDLENEIIRCGKDDRLFAFHVCDFKAEPQHLLFDRGLMGEGAIDIPQIRGWVETAGFNGFNEVEIFSSNYWSLNQHDYLDQIVTAYKAHS